MALQGSASNAGSCCSSPSQPWPLQSLEGKRSPHSVLRDICSDPRATGAVLELQPPLLPASKETELLAETRPRLLTQLSCHLHQASRPAAKHFFVFTGHHRHAGSACTFLLHQASPEVAPPAGTALLEPTAGQGVNYVCSHTVRGLRYQAKCYQMCGDLCQSDLQARMPVWIFNMLVSGVRGSELGVSMQMLHIFSTLTITF